jgi:hypothetical protein
VIKSRILRWAGHVARIEAGRSSFNILTGIPAVKIPLRRPRRRMDLREICINTKNWVDLAQDSDYWRVLVNVAMNPHVP